MPVRKELGLRTIFNLLGPLTNPAFPTVQIVGVFSRRWVKPIAQVLAALGCEEGVVVHGQGHDEIVLHGITQVAEITGGKVSTAIWKDRRLRLNPSKTAASAGRRCGHQCANPAGCALRKTRGCSRCRMHERRGGHPRGGAVEPREKANHYAAGSAWTGSAKYRQRSRFGSVERAQGGGASVTWPNFLEEVAAKTRLKVQALKSKLSLAVIQKEAAKVGKAVPFESAIRRPGRVSLIAELKQASPSAGVIRNETGHRKAHRKLYRGRRGGPVHLNRRTLFSWIAEASGAGTSCLLLASFAKGFYCGSLSAV